MACTMPANPRELFRLAISFINDAWDGTPATDRNLYVASVDQNGAQLAGSIGALYSNGELHVPFAVPAIIQV
jgi:hypothetical protein